MIGLKGVAAAGGIAVLGIVGATVLARTADAGAKFAAIYYSPSTGYWVVNKNAPDPRSADHHARDDCREHAPDCVFVVGIGPPGNCVALAVNPNDPTVFHGGGGGTLQDAEAEALSTIPGGTIKISICND